MAAQLRCPLCNTRLEVVLCTTIREYHPGYHVRGEPLPEFETPTTAVSCSGCEFMVDLEYAGRSPRTEDSITAEIRLLMKNTRNP